MDREQRFPLIGATATGAAAVVLIAALTLTACASGEGSGPATVEEARAFVEETEADLLDHWIKSERAAWVQANFITEDTQAIAADANKDLIAAGMELAVAATRFDGLELPEDVARKLKLLKLALVMPAPRDAQVPPP
jgi:peptidyl-dipeptidase A